MIGIEDLYCVFDEVIGTEYQIDENTTAYNLDE